MEDLRIKDINHRDYVKGQEVNVIDFNSLKKKQRPKAVPVHGKIIFVSDQIITVDHGNYRNTYQCKDIARKEVIITIVDAIKVTEKKAG